MAKEFHAIAKIIADEVVAKLAPKFDKISRAQAMREFGKEWVKYREHLFNKRYEGQRAYFSRSQLNALYTAELESARLVTRKKRAL